MSRTPRSPGGSVRVGDHEPAEVADVLWSHHTVRDGFQTLIGFAD